MTSFDYDKGILAICGKRYKEAEQIFSDLLSRNPTSSLGWSGLGSAKSGMLINKESTLQEAMYCFEKAKGLEPKSVKEIEWILCRSMIQVCKETVLLHNQAAVIEKDANLKILGSTLGFLISPAFGAQRDANAFQQIFGGVGTVAGAAGVVNGVEERGKAHNDDKFSHELMDAIKKSITEFCEKESPALAWFNGEITRLR